MKPFETPVFPPAFSTIQAAVFHWAGEHSRIKSKERFSGGDGNLGYVLELESGQRSFVKVNQQSRLDMFRKEAAGLHALSLAAQAHTDTIHVPRVLAFGTDDQKSFLMIEFLEKREQTSSYWNHLGRGLAFLHKGAVRNLAGFETDNYIGTNPQRNSWSDSWPNFFAHQRLLCQLDLARSQRLASDELQKAVLAIVGRIYELLPNLETKHLVHGDLWAGNAMAVRRGAALYDPAAYYGDFRVDLAMTEFFGGFPMEFYRAYHEVTDRGPEYPAVKNLYNLYHALNHLNAFGSEWHGRCLELARLYS